MKDTPKRIWWKDAPLPYSYTSSVKFAGGTEYHSPELSRDLVRAALERTAETSKEIADQYVGYMSRIEQAIRAMAEDEEAVEAIITSVLGEPT
jgi:hypothetical protein